MRTREARGSRAARNGHASRAAHGLHIIAHRAEKTKWCCARPLTYPTARSTFLSASLNRYLQPIVTGPMDASITALFVYGTLQRGQCRERCWPHAPLSVELATVRGRLYDLGPYPALVAGDDLIGGEVWRLAAEHLSRTLAVLDEVEDVAAGEAGLYARRAVECRTERGAAVRAFAYYYARPHEIEHCLRVQPDSDGVCRWRPAPE
jgi:gamma-glutamylcyclotransferase (GGCT)/AIG2-like uncharacterized protein YtfP